MNLTINFDKVTAEKYIREKINTVLEATNISFLLICSLVFRVLFFGVCGAALPILVMIAWDRGFREGVFECAPSDFLILMLAICGAFLGWIVFVLSESKEYRKARESCRMLKNLRTDIHLLYEGYCNVVKLLAGVREDIKHAYDVYCVLLRVSEIEPLDIKYDAKQGEVRFRSPSQNGDVFTITVQVDEARENTKVSNDTLTWEDGKIVYIEKYRG